MTATGSLAAAPHGCAAAIDSALTGLGWLNATPMAGRPAAELAQCLRQLEQVESMLTTARTAVLAAFIAQDGCAGDGHGSARTWLAWQIKVTRAAAAGSVGWLRRLAAHPELGHAVAAGDLSASWARQLCDWTDRLPEERRADADVILVTAARGGADLTGLAGLAEEMLRRCARPDSDGDDRFADRGVQLDQTFGGAGRLTGDLTPQCAAALAAVLEALAAKSGPEDDRTSAQRDHDALEEACRRLLGSQCLPDRAGQPAQIRLHMTLDQLRGLPGAAEAEAAWAAAGCSPAGPGDDCDAQVAPQVDGQLDPGALDRLTRAWQGQHTADWLSAATRQRLQSSLLHLAADALSGPSGLAAWLRSGLLTGPGAAPSLPLDLGRPTEIIPPLLRRAVASRDTRCAFPGCDIPPAGCQVHHLIRRSDGGSTALDNLILLCSFHHLIAVHRWGWQVSLHPDGTVTATSPDRTRTLRDHGPPPATGGQRICSGG